MFILDVARSSTKYVKNALNIKAKRKITNHGSISHAKNLRNTLKKNMKK